MKPATIVPLNPGVPPPHWLCELVAGYLVLSYPSWLDYIVFVSHSRISCRRLQVRRLIIQVAIMKEEDALGKKNTLVRTKSIDVLSRLCAICNRSNRAGNNAFETLWQRQGMVVLLFVISVPGVSAGDIRSLFRITSNPISSRYPLVV